MFGTPFQKHPGQQLAQRPPQTITLSTMGSMCNNYGTFIAPPGFPGVESYVEGGDTSYRHRSEEYAPSFEEGTTISSPVEHNTPGGSEGSFGLRCKKAETGALFSEMNDDKGRVSACLTCMESREMLQGVLAQCLLACVQIHFLQATNRSRFANSRLVKVGTERR